MTLEEIVARIEKWVKQKLVLDFDENQLLKQDMENEKTFQEYELQLEKTNSRFEKIIAQL